MKAFQKIALIAFMASSCTHSIHQVHMGGFDFKKNPKKGKEIAAKAEQFVVMGFASDTNYVNKAYDQLLSKCPGGSISGIMTEYSTSHGFFSWHNRIYLQGLCYK